MMWSASKRGSFLRSVLLFINCAACVSIIYVCLVHISEEENLNARTSINEFIQAEKLTDDKCIPVCNASACVWHANVLLKNMDSTVDPCENFDYFLCDGFKQKYAFDEKGSVIQENVSPMLNKLKIILENIQAEPESASAKMKTVYDSCINYRSSELQGIKDVNMFLSKLGILNWPYLLPDFNFTHIGLPVVLGNLISSGATEYLQLSSNAESTEEGSQDINFIISFETWSFELQTEVPHAVAVSILKYFDLDEIDIETIIKDHQRVRESVISLYERLDNCEEDCDDIHHIDCFGTNSDDWRYICETTEVSLKILNVTDQVNMESLFVKNSQVEFLKNLFPVLNSLTDRTLVNFMVLNFLNRFYEELNFYFRLSKLKNNQFINEEERYFYEVDRWKYCVRWITKNMQLPLINEFARHYLSKSVTEEIIMLYKDYLFTIIDITNKQKWIPSDVKLDIENEMKAITFNVIALSQYFPNDTYINAAYEKFHPTSESFFRNVLKIIKTRKETLKFLIKNEANIKDLSAIMETNFDVQASRTFSMEYNSIVIHFGMLLPPFHTPDYDRLKNRIIMGSFLIHEIGHYLYSKLGATLKNDDVFFEKEQCVRDQFSRFKFKILNENMNGSKYEVENMPDNVASSVIDKIIEKYYSEQKEVILPGLSYTTKQLLYMNFNQMHCSKSNLEEEIQQKTYEGDLLHAFSEFRILGMMQNSRGFPEAFHCTVGKFMNPPKKCSILDTY